MNFRLQVLHLSMNSSLIGQSLWQQYRRSALSKTFVSRYHDTDITHALTRPTQIVLFVRVHAKPTGGMEIATTDAPMYTFVEPYRLEIFIAAVSKRVWQLGISARPAIHQGWDHAVMIQFFMRYNNRVEESDFTVQNESLPSILFWQRFPPQFCPKIA